jgi:hypothetical protein
MRLSRRRLITAMVLVLWVLLGPVGMAFSSCASMGVTCGAPCALSTCVMPTLPAQAPLPVTSVQGEYSAYHPSTMVKVPTPPPKSLSVSA